MECDWIIGKWLRYVLKVKVALILSPYLKWQLSRQDVGRSLGVRKLLSIVRVSECK